jgi:peptidoglycan/xylan/chitin deacetylase (PgdA/CDA1 family)
MSALHFTGISRLLARLTGGVGVIFMLHRVRPGSDRDFAPNRMLEITPEFLDQTIRLVVARGFEVLSLDDINARISEGDFDRPFACFTFDDGYRDNRDFAYPIFRRHGLPFAIYAPTDFVDGRGDLWWIKLEMVIAAAESIDLRMDGVATRIETATTAQKNEAFDRIYGWLRALPEAEARSIVAELCWSHGIATEGLCRELIMDWDELRDLAGDPLVTIGAHTRRHLALAKLTRAEARLEMEESLRRLEGELGRPVRHFSFPYGDEASAGPREFELARELGLDTAVTSRGGLIRTHHALSTIGLPRVALNGDFQSPRYVKVLLTGAPFALWRSKRRKGSGAIAARVRMPSRFRLAAGTST